MRAILPFVRAVWREEKGDRMDERRADELTALRAEVAALRAKVERPRRRLPRRLAPLAAAALLTALAPLSILAADPPVFTDLGSAAPVHQDDIRAIGNAGITTGFEDPENPDQRLYYPTQTVTRQEMASFLARTAGLGDNTPVANAARLAPSDPAAGGPLFAANELTRLGFVNDTTAATSVPVAAGQTTVATVQLTTTTQAYVRVSFSALLLNSSATVGGASDCPCSVRAYIRQDSGTPQPVKRVNVGTALVGGYDRSDLTGSYVFAAPPGGHTYTLLVEQVGSSGAALTISYPNMQAAIYPFGANGTGAGATDLPTEQLVPQD